MKYGVLIGLLISMVIIVSGCTSTTQNNTSQGNASGIEILVNYTGPWNGTIEYGEGIKSVAGNGIQTFKINGTPKRVTADIKKMDNSTSTLKLEILQNGKVMKNVTMSDPNGGAGVSEMFP